MLLPGIVGRVRGLLPGNYPENKENEQLHIAPTGDALVGQGLPELAEIVRLGDSWQVYCPAFTGLTGVPTNTGAFGLWNGEPQINGKFYVIDSVAITKIIIDVTTNDLFTTWAMIAQAPVTAITDAGNAIVSLSGKRNYGGRGRTQASVGITTVRWTNVGGPQHRAEAIAGSAWQQVDIPLRGMYIVPPQAMFILHVSEVTATASTFRAGIRWHEVYAPLIS